MQATVVSKKKFPKTTYGNRINRSIGGDIGLIIFLLLFSSFMILPFIYVIGNSLKPLNELWIFPPLLWPQNPTLQNFGDLFVLLQSSWVPISRYIFNTLFITVVGTLGRVIICSMASFPLAKHKFPGKNLIFNIIVFALMFGGACTSIPSYIIMVNLGWVNTFWSVIIPPMGTSVGLYLMKQFMETSVPDSLLEAAKIDGANQFSIFLRIVMPCVKPAWLTLVIFSVQELWNASGSSFIFSEELKTFPYAISQILSSGISRAGVGCAVQVIMLIVPISVFVFNQSKVVNTMSTSGMKD